ncbi:MAG: hypothetical protein HGA31_05515 [Candidatus Moranbacteria bacterium]|nr:hypothetical protein [Candidatus Moranbacteria bacterium]
MFPSRGIRLTLVSAIFILGGVAALWRGDSAGRVRADDMYGTRIDEDVTWKTGSEHAFDESVEIADGAKLTIEPGVKIVFSGDYEADGPIYFDVNDGSIEANGTEENPVVFSKADDKTVFSIRFLDTSVFSDEESHIRTSELRHVRIERGGEKVEQVYQVYRNLRNLFGSIVYAEEYWHADTAVVFGLGRVSIKDSVFSASGGADIWMRDPLDGMGRSTDEGVGRGHSQFTVSGSDFKGRYGVPAFMSGESDCTDRQACRKMVTLENDWYGSEKGPRTENGGGDRYAKEIIGTVDLVGFSPTEFFAFCRTCASNVLFLPGAKGSKLYMQTDLDIEDTLWPPDLFSHDLSDLACDEEGESINGVYTKEVFKTAGLTDIYKSFLADLKKKKDGKVINDYLSFPYDWRMNVKDIAYGVTAYPDGYRSLLEQTESLARSSKTGKVTIVTHSNGGLVAKELINRLNEEGNANMVDRVVFVGTPQMGAPISILTLLYGYNESLLGGLLGTDGTIRSLAENLPGAYGLLPWSSYFDRSEDPLVTFSSERTRYKSFLDAYGSKIDDWGELTDFLTAEKDNRDKPEKDDTASENILRRNLLSRAEDTQNELDHWTPPAGVEAIQIAGWGLDTVRGVDFTEKAATKCYGYGSAFMGACVKTGEFEPIYEPKFTVDGDAVVTAPSALMQPESPNVKKYWVDLYRSRRIFNGGENHGTLFEFDSLRDFVSQLISRKENNSALPSYIYTSRPSDYAKAKPRIRMALYSPLMVSVTDADGNHTGPKDVEENGQTYATVEEGIPGSTYYQFGDRKYVSFPEGESIDIRLNGYDNGSYTLKFEEVAVTKTGEETVSHTTFEDLPVTDGTTVELTVPKEGLEHLSTLRADVNGDAPGGEYEVAPVMNGIATLAMAQDNTDHDLTGTDSGATGSSEDSSSHKKTKSGISGVLHDAWGQLVGPNASPQPGEGDSSAVRGEATEDESPVVVSRSSTWSIITSVIAFGLRVMLTGPFLPLNMVFSLWGLTGIQVNGMGLWGWFVSNL